MSLRKHLESLPDTSSQIFDCKQFARLSFYKTSESTATLSLEERWTIKEIRRQPNSVLTYSLLTDILL